MVINDMLEALGSMVPVSHRGDSMGQAGGAPANLGFAHTFGFIHALLKQPLGCIYTPIKLLLQTRKRPAQAHSLRFVLAEAAGRADGTRPFVSVRNLAGLTASNSSEHIIPKSHQPENNMQRKRTPHYKNNKALSTSQVARDGDTCNSLASLGTMASAEHSLKTRPTAHGTKSSMTAAASEAKETNPPSLKTRIQE